MTKSTTTVLLVLATSPGAAPNDGFLLLQQRWAPAKFRRCAARLAPGARWNGSEGEGSEMVWRNRAGEASFYRRARGEARCWLRLSEATVQAAIGVAEARGRCAVSWRSLLD